MTIDVRQADRVCIIDLGGPHTFPAATAELRAQSRKLLANGERLFVLNMLDVPWLDSSGIGEVVACYNVTTGEPVWRHRDAARFWESKMSCWFATPRRWPRFGCLSWAVDGNSPVLWR